MQSLIMDIIIKKVNICKQLYEESEKITRSQGYRQEINLRAQKKIVTVEGLLSLKSIVSLINRGEQFHGQQIFKN